MAGAGYKLYATGDVLSATDVNTYLQEQTVMVFASSTARTTALTGVVAEGMISYLKDTNATEYYDGAAWVSLSNPGDITGVTAGTGISGGGTSGTVTITNSMATTIDAKGDLIGGTGADAFARLAVGANGTVLTADSAEATGLKWSTPASGGKLLQMVSATYSTATTIATTTYTDTGLTATITPTLNTSKILVLITTNVYATRSANQMGVSVKILRDATSIFVSAVGEQADFDAGSLTAVEKFRTLSFSYVDSPATTSATTYKLQGAAQTTTNSGSTTWQKNSQVVTMTLLEIGA